MCRISCGNIKLKGGRDEVLVEQVWKGYKIAVLIS